MKAFITLAYIGTIEIPCRKHPNYSDEIIINEERLNLPKGINNSMIKEIEWIPTANLPYITIIKNDNSIKRCKVIKQSHTLWIEEI